jgi:hypothetical protein
VSAPGAGATPDRRHPTGGWRACLPELTIGAILALATTLAAYAYAGTGIAVLAIAGWSVTSIAFLRTLLPTASEPQTERSSAHSQGRSSFLGFWRKRSILRDATASMISYDTELRPSLQHLLAARLAERHGVSLYADPTAARQLVLRGPRDDALWHWLDPERPAETEQGRAGIPPRTLAAVLDRLERL